MSTPVVENNTLLIDHLDFDIKCSGLMENPVCDNPAKFYLVHSCGCFSYKCISCMALWHKKAEAIALSGWDRVTCFSCNKIRPLSGTTIFSL